MSSPTPSTPPSETNGAALPSRPAQGLFNGPYAGSGTGTPIGFQRFPHNKHLDHVVGAALRQPSPQPTHLGIPGTPGSPHRVLSEEDPGYIAATFEGKQKQMEQGKTIARGINWGGITMLILWFSSDGPIGGEGLLPQ
jgi:glutamate dehydrogenase